MCSRHSRQRNEHGREVEFGQAVRSRAAAAGVGIRDSKTFEQQRLAPTGECEQGEALLLLEDFAERHWIFVLLLPREQLLLALRIACRNVRGRGKDRNGYEEAFQVESPLRRVHIGTDSFDGHLPAVLHEERAVVAQQGRVVRRGVGGFARRRCLLRRPFCGGLKRPGQKRRQIRELVTVADRLNEPMPPRVGLARGNLAVANESIVLRSGAAEVLPQPRDQRGEVRIVEGIAATDEEEAAERSEVSLEEIADLAAKRGFVVTDAKDAALWCIPRAVEMDDALGLTPHPLCDLRRFGQVDRREAGDPFQQPVVVESGDRDPRVVQRLDSFLHGAVRRLNGFQRALEPSAVQGSVGCFELASHELRGAEEVVHVAGVELDLPVLHLRGGDLPFRQSVIEPVCDESFPSHDRDFVAGEGGADASADHGNQFVLPGGLREMRDSIGNRGAGSALGGFLRHVRGWTRGILTEVMYRSSLFMHADHRCLGGCYRGASAAVFAKSSGTR